MIHPSNETIDGTTCPLHGVRLLTRWNWPPPVAPALRDVLLVAELVLVHGELDDVVEAAAALGPEGRLAVLLLDLDHFKEINDTLGHASGDLVLREVGVRLRARLPDNHMVAAVGVGQLVRATLGQPLPIEQLELAVTASIGIALGPDHGSDPELLLQRADVAMYQAKEGHTDIEVYAPERDQYSPRRLALVGALRTAIQNGIAPEVTVGSVVIDLPKAFLLVAREVRGPVGGGLLAKSLFEANLIDEIGFNIHPVLLGSGIPLFYEMNHQIDLELIDCKTLKTGCVLVTYKVKPPGKKPYNSVKVGWAMPSP